MYLQELPNLNRIPSEVLETIPKLNPGQVAVFRSLKVVKDVDAENNTVKTVYPRLFLSYRDTIRVGNKFYPIGIPRQVNSKGEVEEFHSEVFGGGVKFSGKISLSGDNMEDQQKYMFLMLSNYRKGNPYRDSKYPALVEYINVPEESKLNRKRRSTLKDALDVAASLSSPEIRDIVAALNMNENQDIILLRDIVEAYAEANPELFVKSYKDPAFLRSALIKRASDAGIIYWDQRTSKVRWADVSQTVLATLEPDDEKSWVRSFSEYCGSNDSGEKALKEIKKKLKSQEPTLDAAKEETKSPGPGPKPTVQEPVTASNGSAGAAPSFDNL